MAFKQTVYRRLLQATTESELVVAVQPYGYIEEQTCLYYR